MNEVLGLIFITHLVAVAIPGPDFFLMVRSSFTQPFKHCVACALGISLGVVTHFVFSMFFLRFVAAEFQLFFTALKILGCIYLTYLAMASFQSAYARFRHFRNEKKAAPQEELGILQKEMQKITTPSPHSAKQRKNAEGSQGFMAGMAKGYLTNILNPKVVMYFLGIFSLLPEVSALAGAVLWGVVCFFFSATFIWFAGLSKTLFFLQQKINLQKGVAWVESVAGALFLTFAIRFLVEEF